MMAERRASCLVLSLRTKIELTTRKEFLVVNHLVSQFATTYLFYRRKWKSDDNDVDDDDEAADRKSEEWNIYLLIVIEGHLKGINNLTKAFRHLSYQ